MTSPVITVGMSVFNAAPYLRPAVESILAQTEPNFEFLIVNDGSSDDSGEILARFARIDSRITVIEQANQGLVPSLNTLIANAKGRFFARMDADDISAPHRFARQRAFLEEYPDYGVVGSWAEDMDELGRPRSGKGPEHPTNHDDFVAAIARGGRLLCHPAAMMRRDVLESVGGYRPAFRHCEDYDLWLRLAAVTKLCSLPERLIRYRYSETQVSNRHLVEQQVGAALAKLAYEERLAGRPDPTAGLDAVPPVSTFDALFGRTGASCAAREQLAPAILYSEIGLRGDGYPHILDYVRDGHRGRALWRTVARLVRLGEIQRAATLGAALLMPRL